MGKGNLVLSIPEPGKFELIEKPYPQIKSGRVVVKMEIRFHTRDVGRMPGSVKSALRQCLIEQVDQESSIRSKTERTAK